jgi:Mg2+ and Co2+ transporter CorA
MMDKENLTHKEVEQLYGKPIENDGSEPVIYTKQTNEPQDLKLYELYETDIDNTNTRSGKMSRLKKKATEMLTEREAVTSFNTNLNECLKGLTSVSDDFHMAMMFLDSLKSEHYLSIPTEIREYLSNSFDSLDDMYKQIEKFQKQLETEEIKFTNNH